MQINNTSLLGCRGSEPNTYNALITYYASQDEKETVQSNYAESDEREIPKACKTITCIHLYMCVWGCVSEMKVKTFLFFMHV